MRTLTIRGAKGHNSFRVSGSIRFANDLPASRTRVVASDRDLRNEQPLGEAQTDGDGAYRIEYSEKQFLNQERGTADLVVKVLDDDGSVLATAPTLFNAPPDATIDLTIPLERREPPTLFERISSALEPLLGRVRLEELEEDKKHQDLTFLQGETGFEKRVLARFVLAHDLALRGIQKEFWFALLGGAFFDYADDASLKENLARLSRALPTLDARAVRKALAGSFNRREIAARLQERTDEWVEEFLRVVSRRALGDAGSPTFERSALEHANIKVPEKQEEFARLFNRYRALTPDLVTELKKDGSFKEAEIDDLCTSYRLAELTRGDFSVVKLLKERFDVRRPEQIRTLAKLSEAEWIDLIEREHKSGALKLPLGLGDAAMGLPLPEAELYAKSLEREFREAFPTAAFAGGLDRALRNGGARGMRHAEALSRVLERHPEFDFLRTSVDEFLSNGARAEFQTLAKDESFRSELKAVQRVFKLTPTFEATDAMLADGVHSAQMVYRMGVSEFVRRYGAHAGFSEVSARAAWNRAADTHAAVLTIIGDLKALDAETLPRALQTGSNAVTNFPNWESLFQSGDSCQCEHCRSVLSPAAYFTDLLLFLRDRGVKDILFKRRPDLGYLELNCENALTTLPYVDVVCEVLERAIDASGDNDLVLTGFTAMPGDEAARNSAVASAFRAALEDTDGPNADKEKAALGDHFSLSQVHPDDPNLWVVHGDNATYLLKKKGTADFCAELLPNTKAGSEELRAYPAYVNPKAYEKLRHARFPFALPFDLFAEEARAALQKCSVARWDLMRTFRGPGADPDVAAEYVGVSVDAQAPIDEKRLIVGESDTQVTEGALQEVWGETEKPEWLKTLSNVKTFLGKAGLEYDELLALIDLPFINPTGEISIQHLDASCDTGMKEIQGFVPGKLDRLDRIHRFLRLWRKLGTWKMWELDLAIRCSGIGHGSLDERFLVNLYYFARLKTRLGAKATVEQLCGLFDNLNTETHFTKLNEKRAEGLYQSLFLNKKLSQPLDPAFDVAAVAEPQNEQKISGHRPSILAALGVSETELDTLAALTRASDGHAYITDDLTLNNLSFLWLHSWLAKTLKFKASEWATLLKLLQRDIIRLRDDGTWVPFFSGPQVAWEFVENVDHLKATGFTVDELNWLLAADGSARAAVKETDAARFLTALRKDLQLIRSEYDPGRHDFLDPPADIDRLTALLLSLLQRLNRSEAEAKFFVDTLKDEVVQATLVPGLPAGFAFPEAITGAPHDVPIHYEPVLQFNGVMTAEQREVLLSNDSLAPVTGLSSYQKAIRTLFDNPGSPAICQLPPGFSFPTDIIGAPHNIPISYKPMLRFRGLMTDVQRSLLLNDDSLHAVTANETYRRAIEDFFLTPRLAIKFLDPVFTAPLSRLPGVVDFAAAGDRALAPKISYDYELHALRAVGILSSAEKQALDELSDDFEYRDAVGSLFAQPRTGAFSPGRLWLRDDDLGDPNIPLEDKQKENVAKAVKKALHYLSQTLSEALVIRQASTQLGLTEALTDALLAEYTFPALHFSGSMTEDQRTILLTDASLGAIVTLEPYQKAIDELFKGARQAFVVGLPAGFALPAAITGSPNNIAIRYESISLLAHFTGPFVATAGVVEASALKSTFDGWFWAHRIAALCNKWKLTRGEWKRLRALAEDAQLLDFGTVPLNDTSPAAPIDRFLRTSRLVRFKHDLTEAEVTLLEVLEKLQGPDPVTLEKFAEEFARLNDAWSPRDVEALIPSLGLVAEDCLLVDDLERLGDAFHFLEKLNAGPETVKDFSTASVTEDHTKTLRKLLQSKFGPDTWPNLSAQIQDALRGRKRDALAAYLLAQGEPTDSPTGKWENTNDLYAYYLLDVEMAPCQLTSRMVQATGSVQLFVQRCFMGLEPEVKVQADGEDGDSAWRWWKWMRKYRVWEANRKVFLWPENWIEPELKRDRSSFFKDLESELLQDEINQETAERAFANYLEKLDGVAQLEVAGFYQEDDGDNTVVHVFGRTTGAEPHIYYYRRYDYRQWTPWEKVDLDIQGDYLIPAVVNNRLFLFWPVFTEVSDEESNIPTGMPNPLNGATLKAPDPESHAQEITVEPTVAPETAKKKLRLQMAVSDYRQGKWTPKRVSKQYEESEPYAGEIVRKHYRFFPVDRSSVGGGFGIKYEGTSMYTDENGQDWEKAPLCGAFNISGCSGVPERDTSLMGTFEHAIRPERASTGEDTSFLKWEELGERADQDDDFTFESTFAGGAAPALIPVLGQTPGIFKMVPPWQLSYLDRFWLQPVSLDHGSTGESPYRARSRAIVTKDRGKSKPAGTWLPFFYSDKGRSFFVLPSLEMASRDDVRSGGTWLHYPDIKRVFRTLESAFEKQFRSWLNELTLPNPDSPERKTLEAALHKHLGGDILPPFEDPELRDLLVRLLMSLVDYRLGALSLKLFQSCDFHFKNFYHPFVCDFRKLIYDPLQGIPGLMRRETQLKNSGFSFPRVYLRVSPATSDPTVPDWAVTPEYPEECVDFDPDGACSPYNWELFFHAPLLIANALSKNQRFEEAREWYHFIFNPLGVESTTAGGSAMSKYWLTKPFFETKKREYVQQRIDNILGMLAGDTSVPGYSPQAKKALEDQVSDWRTNPFEPHRIANYRRVAYQKTVVMKYLDNLIAWGDYLFRQDSMESINEATQLYILAADLLGSKPKKIPPHRKPPLETFNELERKLDAFGNAIAQLENLIPVLAGTDAYGPESAPLPVLYFCIPQNDKMLSYWDTIADRLYKIRHCMNIDGVVRQLALFEPPIEPGALVKAMAAGVDIGAALADVNAPLPLYRFNVLLQKANEVCNDAKGLGAALLSALEKNDAEGLSLARQGQEIRVLEAVQAVREKQVEEAKENLAGLKKSKELAELKRKYYESREFISLGESAALALSNVSTMMSTAIQLGYSLSAATRALPQFTTGGSGFGGSPVATVTKGGDSLAEVEEDSSKILSVIATTLDKGAGIASTLAGYQRRQDEWDFQENLATKEIEQIEKSIAAAELRVAIAEKELENQVMQIENAKAIDAFMRSKYTNEDLYLWQIGQVSGVYFQSYRLAYDLAKRAERCFRFELGLQDSNFITFGHWDSLKKGLLSGEKLQYDLRRLESAYLEKNRREFEMTKHVSLALLDPLALLELRQTGRCFFRLPEEAFDFDFPGHYFRRIKSVSVTLPCVAGPYTTISCTLRLLKNSIRLDTTDGDNGYPRNAEDSGLPADDPRFVENNIPVNSIAISSGQNDSGLFETNLRDERYLPFEGAGAISDWELELPANPSEDLAQYDYDTIADVVLHIRYTAREGGDVLRQAASAHVKTLVTQARAVGSVRLFSVRHEFPSEWASFQSQTPASGKRAELAIKLRPEHYPFWSQGRLNKVVGVNVRAVRAKGTGTHQTAKLKIFDNATEPSRSETLGPLFGDVLGGSFRGEGSGIPLPEKPDSELKLFFEEKDLKDLWIAVTWSA